MKRNAYPSTGYDDLDEKLNRIWLGDNIVWQVDSITEYMEFVQPFVRRAIEQNRNLIYFRFADHEPLVKPQPGVKIFELDSTKGFESFSTQVYNIIKQQGYRAFYVFDCLSDLLRAWATDLMIGNFFIVTCPYLFELETVAYFAIYRNSHSFQTVARIRETTQLLIDVYCVEKTIYLHPLKVWNRYSPTMFLPHKKEDDGFVPLTSSMDSAKLFSYISAQEIDTTQRYVDYWDKIFLDAQAVMQQSDDPEKLNAVMNGIIRIMITRDPRMAQLAVENFTLADLLNIKSRLIGTGYVGGKAAGMLIARAILGNDKTLDWESKLEAHDSFYVGSDVFYSYVIENNNWKLLMKQKTPEGYFAMAKEMQARFMLGSFPPEIKEQFLEMIEYYGQSPIIVRSSSLLEDSFGHAFAGKYESHFLVNQGSPEQRYEEFETAVKQIYASTMSEDALVYRRNRGLDKHDEQMALLVQRVSGSHHNDYFFPYSAGVGVSYNTFVWDENLDPHAGMIRIVLGLGTRAVDRVDDDYPRLAAVDKPLLSPHVGTKDITHFSQRKVDLLNLTKNSIETVTLTNLLESVDDLDISMVAHQYAIEQPPVERYTFEKKTIPVLTFDNLFTQTDFIQTMNRLFRKLEEIYNYPLDIEFTLNFSDELGMQINLLQCRPLQTRAFDSRVEIPTDISNRNILFSSQGNFMGGNISIPLDKVVYVKPDEYIKLSVMQKYELARLVGKVNQIITETQQVLLIGPGRWGTTTPSLGVPINFAEISKVTAVCELSYPKGNLMPELSFGSHFFQDLVESQIFYAALFTQHHGVSFNPAVLEKYENDLTRLVPDSEQFADVLTVYDFSGKNLMLMSDIVAQKVICFLS